MSTEGVSKKQVKKKIKQEKCWCLKADIKLRETQTKVKIKGRHQEETETHIYTHTRTHMTRQDKTRKGEL